jgi:hypothetical protein
MLTYVTFDLNATHIPSNTSSAEYGAIDAEPEDSGNHTAGQTGTRILSHTYSPLRVIHIKTDDKDCNKRQEFLCLRCQVHMSSACTHVTLMHSVFLVCNYVPKHPGDARGEEPSTVSHVESGARDEGCQCG